MDRLHTLGMCSFTSGMRVGLLAAYVLCMGFQKHLKIGLHLLDMYDCFPFFLEIVFEVPLQLKMVLKN